jgi:hypothetical protein
MHILLRARVVAPLLHLFLFLLAWIPILSRFLGPMAGVPFLLLWVVYFPITYLWVAIGLFCFGACSPYALTAFLILGTAWWFFLGLLIDRTMSLHRRR